MGTTAYREEFEAAGMVFSGTSPDGNLVEIVEIPEHPFFVASQFHPEFIRPDRPQAIFMALLARLRTSNNKIKMQIIRSFVRFV